MPHEACAKAKAKQKSLLTRVATIVQVIKPKIKASKVNEQMNLDISTIKVPTGVKVNVDKPQWLMPVDEKTNMKWSEFYKHKNNFVEPLCTKMHKQKEAGMQLQILRCNNTGENKLLEKRSDSVDWKLNI
eukprot:4789512-Ditylum_brightwellii.AAC.1